MKNIKIIDRRTDKSADFPDETPEPFEDSEAVWDLVVKSGSEINNIISEGRGKNILSGILNAIKRITDSNELAETLKTWNLDQLWELVTTPPWVKPYIEPLKEEIARRFKENPNISIQDAVSNIDLNCKLKPGFTVVADLNGYSNFQYQATDSQKAELDESYQREMFALCKKFNAKLLQAPAGDAYVFYVEENLPAFLKALKASKIKVPLRNPDPEHYPNGNFTFSTGIAKADGDINLSIYTSQKGIDDGLIDVNGSAYVRAIHGQKHVGKNEMEVDFETQAYLAEMGINLNGTKITEEHLAQVKIPTIENSASGGHLPHNRSQAVAVIAALAQASHPHGCISTIDKHSRGKESTVNAVGMTSIAFQIGSLDDLARNQEKYDTVIKKYFALREKYPEFFTFKKDGEKLHVHTNLPLNEENGKKIVAFCRDMAEIITKEGFKLGIGVGYTETMVRTRIIDSSLEERAGAGIVKSVRLGTAGRDLRLDAEFCKKAFGNILEFETVKAKGGDIMCLKIDLKNIDPENITGKNLYGVDAEMESIDEFIESLGTNGNLLRIHSNLSGSGVSALMRHALRKAIKTDVSAFEIEKTGMDSLGFIRGLVTSIYPDLPKNISEEELLTKFDELLLDTETLNKKRLLVLDSQELSPNERALFERFAAAIVTTKTALIHNGDFGGSRIEIKEMKIDDAVEMLMEINEVKLDPFADLAPLSLALEIFSKEKQIPLTPRNLIYIFNAALKKEGGIISFDQTKTESLQTGELGRKIRGGVSEERQFILGLIASIKFKAKAKVLWPIYCALKNISHTDSGKEQTFLEDLNYLLEHDLLEKSGEDFDLKDRSERDSAVLLAVKEEDKFSQMLLDQNTFDGEEIDCLEAKFQHELKSDINEENLIASCGKIAEHYFKLGLTAEARRIYTEYLKRDGFDQIKPENFDFFMRMALTFHTSEEEQRKIAEEIYAKIETQKPTDEIKANLIWRRYRLCTLDSKNYPLSTEGLKILTSSTDENELDDVFEMRERQVIFKNLIFQLKTLPDSDERNQLIATIEMDNLLRKAYTLRDFKNTRMKNGEFKNYYDTKKTEFKDEFTTLMKTSAKGTEETESTFLRLCGGTSNQLGEHEAAITIFTEARKKLGNLNPPDLFQMNDTLQGTIEAFDYICREMADSPDVSREKTFEFLQRYDLIIKELESAAILAGDVMNRANAMLGYCALCEYKIKAIAKSIQPDSDKAVIENIVATDTRYADDYVKLKLHQSKGENKEKIVKFSELAKAELAVAVQLLPIEFRA